MKCLTRFEDTRGNGLNLELWIRNPQALFFTVATKTTHRKLSNIWKLAMLWYFFLAFRLWPLVLAEPRRLDGPTSSTSSTSSCDEFLPQEPRQTFVESSDYSKFSLIGGDGNYCYQNGQKLTQETASSATWCRGYNKQECQEWCERENCPGVLFRDSGGTCHLKASGSDMSLRVPSSCCYDHHVSLCVTSATAAPPETTVAGGAITTSLTSTDQNTDHAMASMAGRWVFVAMLPIWLCTVLVEI